MIRSENQKLLIQRFISPQFVDLFPCRQIVDCNFLHPNTSCTFETTNKMYEMLKNNSKMYLLIHLIPFLLFKLKKIKNKQTRISAQVLRTAKKFIASLLCMVINTGAVKVYLCMNSNTVQATDARILIIPFIISSLGIILETGSRKQQMVFFALVRAIRSLYVLIKRRICLEVPFERNIVFILSFGILSYIFYQKPNLLKSSSLLMNMWGDCQKMGNANNFDGNIQQKATSVAKQMKKDTESILINTGLQAFPQQMAQNM